MDKCAALIMPGSHMSIDMYLLSPMRRSSCQPPADRWLIAMENIPYTGTIVSASCSFAVWNERCFILEQRLTARQHERRRKDTPRCSAAHWAGALPLLSNSFSELPGLELLKQDINKEFWIPGTRRLHCFEDQHEFPCWYIKKLLFWWLVQTNLLEQYDLY